MPIEKIYSHHLYEVTSVQNTNVLEFIREQSNESLFFSENCFSIKNKDGLFLTAFPNGDVKFFATKCGSWEKFYILDTS